MPNAKQYAKQKKALAKKGSTPYQERLAKGAAAGKTRQESRGVHPKEAPVQRPRGRVAPELFEEPYRPRYIIRTFTSAPSRRTGSGEIVYPWTRQGDIYAFIHNPVTIERIEGDRIYFRFGGLSARGSGDPAIGGYVTNGYEHLAPENTYELFMDSARLARGRFVDGEILDVHFAWTNPIEFEPYQRRYVRGSFKKRKKRK